MEPVDGGRPRPGNTDRSTDLPSVRRIALSIAVLVAVFGFALPRLADYSQAWDAIAAMTIGEIAVLTLVGLLNLVTYWPVIMLAQPGLRLREAAVVNQASTAVANTVPAGSAVAVGVTFRILRAWGFTTESITNQVVLTGIWNQLVKLTMPVVAIIAVAMTGELEGSAVRLAAWGVVLLAGVLSAGAVILRNATATERAGAGLDRVATAAFGMMGRPRQTQVASWLLRVRNQLIATLHRRALSLSAASIVSHLSLYVMLLTAIRVIGIPAAELSWARVLVAFALVRLLSAVPVTPGGIGVVELGYVGFLAAGGASGLESSIAAAVIVFRAITYVMPIALGGLAWILFERMESWRRPPNSRGISRPEHAVAA